MTFAFLASSRNLISGFIFMLSYVRPTQLGYQGILSKYVPAVISPNCYAMKIPQILLSTEFSQLQVQRNMVFPTRILSYWVWLCISRFQ